MSERELALLKPDLDDEEDYPSSDGKPMAETGIHVLTMLWLFQALEDFFETRGRPFIATDMFWYYREGERSKRVAPDAMVCMVEKYPHRRSYLQWNENGVVPSIVFEVASKSTWRKDLDKKYDLYERLGVREYVIFDPEARYLVPQLQMFRLRDSTYRRVIGTKSGVHSSELGFSLSAEGIMLRLIDTATGMPIPTKGEAVQTALKNFEIVRDMAAEASREARSKIENAQEQIEDQQREMEVLRAELDRLRSNPGEANS